MIPRFRTVLLDVDSTVAALEGIDWLATKRGPDGEARGRGAAARRRLSASRARRRRRRDGPRDAAGARRVRRVHRRDPARPRGARGRPRDHLVRSTPGAGARMTTAQTVDTEFET